MAVSASCYLSFQKKLYFSISETNPISELLEFIWFNEPKTARSITRSRIYTRIKPTPRCLGMVRVAGKRLSLLDEDDFKNRYETLLLDHQPHKTEPLDCFWPLNEGTPIPIQDSIGAMKLAKDIALHSPQKIGALLLDSNFRILSWGWNDHFKNRILHAEIMAIKNHWHLHRKPIPKGAHLFTTLFPCAMCAGYLHSACEDFSSMNITYLENDPGPMAQNSILIPGSHLHGVSGINQLPKIFRF